MTRLIEAFKRLFVAASLAGGDVSKTASFTLDNVNWKGTLRNPEPMAHPIVDRHLQAACASSGQGSALSRELAQALWEVSGQMVWRESSKGPELGPDVAIFSPNFSATTVIGHGGLLPAGKVIAGFSLQGRDTYYPPHAHRAEESYWIIGGDGDWRVGSRPWFAVQPGDSIYHGSGARHAMQTNEQPLLAIWLWTSHLQSEVMIVRA